TFGRTLTWRWGELGLQASIGAPIVVDGEVWGIVMATRTEVERVAMLVAAGRPQAEVLDAAISEAGPLFGAATVTLVRAEGAQDEVVVVAAWNNPDTVPVEPGSLYHPDPESATLAVLQTGIASRAEEWSPERGRCSVIAAPVIITGSLLGALAASRDGSELFPSGAEIRLRSFADLAAQSIAN